ncbi:hypothetical protein GCM10009821_02360 [Aeromicrobium halocynthiae]|uniref:DUF2550 family protein n=1 Tax=Aeromicrobium halocynthiae TaxID=560557 RepID=A0ABN2VRA3_9ACTN
MLEIIGIVLAGLALGVVAVLLTGVVRLRRMRSRHRERLAVIAPTHSAPAALFGLASDGAHQTRGVGTVAMSDTQLMFVQLVPDREVLIERNDITSVQLTRTFMGSTATRDLVVLTWEANGLGDAVALSMDDADGWRSRLDA